jgi:AAA domain
MSRPTVLAVLRALREHNLHDAREAEHVWTADCPVCRPLSDGLAPLRVTEQKADGPATLRCRSGCTSDAILTALGLADLDGARLRIVRASEVAIEAVRFLVPERVPLGAVTILCGDPGLGKSTWTCEIATGTTIGRYGEPAPVLMANAEDGAAHVIVPRLAAAGADLARVEMFTVPDADGERPFTIPDDVPRLEAHAAETGARLIVVDPLNAHLSDATNAHRDHSIRRALAPLSAMAQRLGAAVVVVVHLNKGAGTDALYRVGGSIGLVGGARSVLLFARDPEDEEDGPRRALGHIKSNWSKLAETTLYEHQPTDVTLHGATVETHRLVAIGESDIDGRSLLGVDREDPPATKRERALELLADVLADGAWHRAKEVEQAASRAEISRRLLYKAADEAGIERERRGYPAIAWWRLAVVQVAAAQQSCTAIVHNNNPSATTGDLTPADSQSCTLGEDCTTAPINVVQLRDPERNTVRALGLAARCDCPRPLPSPDADGGLSCARCGRTCADWKGGAA